MSSHRRRTKYFSRDSKGRRALLRGLVSSLVSHERITTTVEKAKEVRRHVEKAITLGKKGDLATRRLLLSRFPHVDVVKKLVDDLAVRFKERPGGYTRVIRIGRRPGDTAEMAFLEFVDYDYSTKLKGDSEDKKPVAQKKSLVDRKLERAETKLVAAKKKHVRKSQRTSRAKAR